MTPTYFFFFSPTCNDTYIKWLNKVEKKKQHVWKTHSIYNLIQSSRISHKYNANMLSSDLFFKEGLTNTFHLCCGMITPNHFNVFTIIGLRTTGDTYDPSLCMLIVLPLLLSWLHSLAEVMD